MTNMNKFKNINMEDLKLEEYTSPCPVVIDVDASVDQAVEIMKQNGIRHLPVREGKKIVGILSDRDLKLFDKKEWAEKFYVREIMTVDPYMVHENTPISEVAFTMSDKKIGSALVFDDSGKLKGIFTTTDALNILVEIFRGVKW